VVSFFATAAPAAAIVATKPAAAAVYVTKTGACYHRDGCRSLRRSRIPISRAEAVKKGYRPCKACKP
jgi:methylphosphotriester-DNA--protein-cysteine methyltransferase